MNAEEGDKTFVVKIGKNGAITIPAAIRRRRGWKKGQRLSIERVDDGIVIVPVPDGTEPPKSDPERCI